MSNHEKDHDTEHNDDHPGCSNCVSNRANQTTTTVLLDSLNKSLIECTDTVNAWMEANGLDSESSDRELKAEDIPLDVASAIMLTERIGLAAYWLLTAASQEIWDAVPFVEAYVEFIYNEVDTSVEIAGLQAMFDAEAGGSDD